MGHTWGQETKCRGKDGQKTVRGGQRGKTKCPIYCECGGCQYLHLTYDQQLKEKQKRMEELLGGVCPVRPIIGMEEPYHYRNKVHAVFGLDRKNNPISGIYKEGTHRILPVDSCLIEDQKADEIIVTIRSMLRSFKIRVFDEDTGYGLLRDSPRLHNRRDSGRFGDSISSIPVKEQFRQGAS